MFAYLSKKISIPNNSRIECVGWSGEQGWVGVGGETTVDGQRRGLLKILRLDEQKGGLVGQQSGLQSNINLENHNGSVQIVVWNDRYQKLTTSDD